MSTNEPTPETTTTTTTPADDAPTFPHRASYSPQDDKLRLFLGYRIPKAEWDALRAEGWTWTMKQDSDLSAPWTPRREDTALRLAGEIEDEDEPREARSADRAERFMGYQERREGEAAELADRYDAAPRVHAAQDAERAARAAARHDRLGDRAADKWSTAEYWRARTAGVIAHALYLERADVRHRRIKGIESEIRGIEKDLEDDRKWRALWLKVAAMTETAKQDAAAAAVADSAPHWREFDDPHEPGERRSLGSMLSRDFEGETLPRISGAEAAALYLASTPEPDAPRRGPVRWLAHLRLRLEYENQMLAAVGGTLANATEIVAGGFLGRHRVVKVSKDRVGRVSRVYVLAPIGYGAKPETLVEKGIRAEKLDPADYRAPTPEELAEFLAERKERNKAKPKAPPLVNPDAASAQALQDELNRVELADFTRRNGPIREDGRAAMTLATPPAPSAVLEMDSATWAKLSAGTYAKCAVQTIREDATVKSNSNLWTEAEARRDKVPVLCRVRLARNYPGADRVIVLTDKPRGPIGDLRVPTVAAPALAAGGAS